jgi:PAS domain S-box-containing protein
MAAQFALQWMGKPHFYYDNGNNYARRVDIADSGESSPPNGRAGDGSAPPATSPQPGPSPTRAPGSADQGLQSADRILLFIILAATLLAALSIVGRLTGFYGPGTPAQGGPPTTPGSALFILGLAAVLFVSRPSARPWPVLARVQAPAAKWIPRAFLVAALASFFVPSGLVNEWLVGGGALFFLIPGAAVLARKRRPRLALAIVLVLVALFFAVLLASVYALASPLANASAGAGTASVIIVFIGLLAGILLLEPGRPPVSTVIGQDAVGATMRRVLPFVLFGTPLIGFLGVQGEAAGLYTSTVRAALTTAANVGMFSLVLVWTARSLGRVERARAAAEEARLASERWFATAFRASPVPLTITDRADGAFIDLNPAAAELFGLPREAAIGRTSLELGLVSGATRADRLARVEREGNVRNSEISLTAKDGRRLTVLASIEPMDYGERPVFLTALVDVTERTRAEEEVRRSRNALAEAQRIGGVGSWEWDPVADKATWSDQLYRIFGVDPKDPALGYKEALSYIHPDDVGVFADDVKRAIEGPLRYNSNYRILRGGKDLRYLHSQGEVTRDASGKATWMVGFVEDITERKLAEEAILKSREELAAQAAELSRSNAELEQFAYVASHDLQEPLRMVASYVQLLRRRYQGKIDGEADEFIQFAVEGATRMQSLINDLLTYSRVGTRGKPFAAMAAADAVKQALENLQLAVEESHAVVQVGQLPTVRVDETQFVQLFQNLISNAIKYRGSEPPLVQVSAKRVDGAWQFEVKDNGIGIDPKHFERIFIIFQRLQARDDTAGTGIGLALCKKIVERHGGRIWVESAPGKGSSVLFTIADEAKRGGARA